MVYYTNRLWVISNHKSINNFIATPISGVPDEICFIYNYKNLENLVVSNFIVCKLVELKNFTI